MAVNAQLRSDDHVLLLDIPSVAELQVMSRILMSGSLVAIGSEDDVESARRAMAEFDNVMFIAATPDRIPWREAYFTKIIVPPPIRADHGSDRWRGPTAFAARRRDCALHRGRLISDRLNAFPKIAKRTR